MVKRYFNVRALVGGVAAAGLLIGPSAPGVVATSTPRRGR